MANNDLFFSNPQEWFRNEMRNFLRGGGNWSGNNWRSGGTPAGWTSGRRRTTGVFPPVNIYDDGEGFRVRAELPGVDKDNLEINAKGAELTIRGQRSDEDFGDEVNWHRRERQTGTFARTVTLPEDINTSKVRATLEQGVLDVYAPRAEAKQPKKITIQT